MNRTNEHDEFDRNELPVSMCVRVERGAGIGTVSDLGDEEPCDTNELERLALWDLYGPLLELRLHGRRGRLVASDGDLDWSVCGVVDCAERWRSVMEERSGRNGQRNVRFATGRREHTVPATPEQERALRAYVRRGILVPEHICDAILRARVTT